MSARSNSNITTSQALAIVPEGFRPNENYFLYGFFGTSYNNNSVGAYAGRISSSGEVSQGFSSMTRNVFLVGEYRY